MACDIGKRLNPARSLTSEVSKMPSFFDDVIFGPDRPGSSYSLPTKTPGQQGLQQLLVGGEAKNYMSSPNLSLQGLRGLLWHSTRGSCLQSRPRLRRRSCNVGPRAAVFRNQRSATASWRIRARYPPRYHTAVRRQRLVRHRTTSC